MDAILAEKDHDPAHEETLLSQCLLLMMILIMGNLVALNFRRRLAKRFKLVDKLIQDATVTTSLGLMVGAILTFFKQKSILAAIGHGYEAIFMLVLLPIIIFESTINMHKKSFFKNIGSILMFAIFGTGVAICITAAGLYGINIYFDLNIFSLLEALAFGSLISATDPVSVLAIFKEMNADKMLYSLIFGESMLNDAISITAYNTFAKINASTGEVNYVEPFVGFIVMFLGSMLTGFFVAIVLAIIVKRYFRDRYEHEEAEETHDDHSHNKGTETVLMILTPWIAYLIGEGLESLSGIVTIVFCGIAMKKYTLPNMSNEAKKLTQTIYGILSHTFENLTFMFIGIGFFSFKHDWVNLGISFFLLTSLLITFARFFQVFFVGWILNRFREKNKITPSFLAVMGFSGFRGAMAFALATTASKTFSREGSGKAMLTLSMVYISLTTYVIGTFLVPILQYFDVQDKSEKGTAMLESRNINDRKRLWNRFKNRFGSFDEGLKRHFEGEKRHLVKVDYLNSSDTIVEEEYSPPRLVDVSLQPQGREEIPEQVLVLPGDNHQDEKL